MTTAKIKKEVLDEWSEHFPQYRQWKNQFLIQRNGCLLSGICLDTTRDPTRYRPTFFFHNLLEPSSSMTLSYGVPLRTTKGGYKELKYGLLTDVDVTEFKHQFLLSHNLVTFENFFNYVLDIRQGRYGAFGFYLPHALTDIITIGSYLGDDSYYLSVLEKCAALIEANRGVINLNIIGSVNQWLKYVEGLIKQDYKSVIQKELEAHKLPLLDDREMSYTRIPNFWEYFSSKSMGSDSLLSHRYLYQT